MARYFEVDKGRFDSMLVRDDCPRPVAVASTHGDEARLEPGFKAADQKAVKEFCDLYGVRVPGLDWWNDADD